MERRAAPCVQVYAVKGVESGGTLSLFPKKNRQNFCYVCVDPSKRHFTVWYHGYKSYW